MMLARFTGENGGSDRATGVGMTVPRTSLPRSRHEERTDRPWLGMGWEGPDERAG